MKKIIQGNRIYCKSFMFQLLTISFLFLCSGCSSQCETYPNLSNGKDYSYYSSGELKMEAEVIDCLYNGRYVEYYKSGKIKLEGQKNNGRFVGKLMVIKENGQVEKELFYSDESKISGAKFYFEYHQIELNTDSSLLEIIKSNGERNKAVLPKSFRNSDIFKLNLCATSDELSFTLITRHDILVFDQKAILMFNMNDILIRDYSQLNDWNISDYNVRIENGSVVISYIDSSKGLWTNFSFNGHFKMTYCTPLDF